MRPFFVATAAAILAALVACGDPTSSSLPPAPSGAPCVPAQSVSGEPPTDPNGPFYHQIAIGESADGSAVAGAAQVLDRASAPDGVRLSSGTVLVYYVNGEDGAVWVARLEETALVPLAPIRVNGVRAPAGVVDPDVQALPSGDVRLTYLGDVGTPTAENPNGICIADSDDGINFTVRSVALVLAPTTPVITDPSVVRLATNSWLMALSQGQRTIIAHSTDGYHFTRDTILFTGSMPELSVLSDGVIRLFACSQGISTYQSPDGGFSWEFERILVAPPFNGHPTVCDPSQVAGAGLFVFRTAG